MRRGFKFLVCVRGPHDLVNSEYILLLHPVSQVAGHQIYACVIGVKGDWPYLRKARVVGCPGKKTGCPLFSPEISPHHQSLLGPCIELWLQLQEALPSM